MIAVSYNKTELQSKAKTAAQELKLPLVEENSSEFSYLLMFTPEYVGLKIKNVKKIFYIDFLAGKIRYRSKQVSFRNELLAKAIKIKPDAKLTVVDATAGLGRDSFILAALGYNVIMLERSPIMFYLLNDALQRASKNPATQQIAARLQLILTDSIEWLLKNNNIDVIYLDPMFPEKQKTAKAKKDLQILQDIIGKDSDSDTLFTLAISKVNKRVIVKRPRLAPPLKGLEPAYSLHGSSSRFDIYLV